jgi:hypothetical protein
MALETYSTELRTSGVLHSGLGSSTANQGRFGAVEEFAEPGRQTAESSNDG